jgi:hypothetical protein
MNPVPVRGLPSGAPAFRASLTRIWPDDLDDPVVEVLPRARWAFGDYAVGEVEKVWGGRTAELADGREVPLSAGDFVIGALGSRFATLEATGSWEDVQEDGVFHLLGGGGIFGRVRSVSSLLVPLVKLRYTGHLMDGVEKRTMRGCSRRILTPGPSAAPSVSPPSGASAEEPAHLDAPQAGRASGGTPVILLTGSSMSAGKTTAARVVVRRLRAMGLRVVAAKFTGAGRYRDILAMRDAGAEAIFDFVDAGLPSTHCPTPEFREAAKWLLDQIEGVGADVAVVEIGASPLEPYNGTSAVALLRDRIRFHILCASDPYAVVGVLQAYGVVPDLVTGTTSNTEAGVQLVDRLTGLRALDVRLPAAMPDLDAALRRALELDGGEGGGGAAGGGPGGGGHG